MADRPAWGRQADFEPLPKNWARLRRRVLRRSELCHVCRLPGADEVDHIVPRSAGGTNDEANLAPIHANPCHRRKTAREGHAVRWGAMRAASRRPVGRHPGLAS